MKAKDLIKKLQKLDANDKVLLAPYDCEYGSQIDSVSVRRVYDNDARNGERRVALIKMMDYGAGEDFEFIERKV